MSLSGGMTLHPNDTRTITEDQELPIGTMGVTKDGRAYRYTEAGGTALSPGKLTVTAAQIANHENIAVAEPAAVGDFKVTVTLGATAATANDYADGYLVVNDAAGEGIAYAISGHPAADASANLVITLSEEIKVALTTSSQVSLQKNPWKDTIISVADQLDMPVGIPNVAITAGYYGWTQTKGVCSALADETLAIGVDLTTGTAVVGAVEAADAAGEPVIGKAIMAGVDTEYAAIYLQID